MFDYRIISYHKNKQQSDNQSKIDNKNQRKNLDFTLKDKKFRSKTCVTMLKHLN
jgi:hypothetical protein